MKNLLIPILICLFSCQQNKSQEKKTASKNTISTKQVEEKEHSGIIPVKFDNNLILNWNTNTNQLEHDSNYMILEKDKQKLNLLIYNISNKEDLNIGVCSKKETLKKGDIAFIYLWSLNHIQAFKCLKIQFDVIEFECSYPNALLDYLENNREKVKEKVKKCLYL